MPDNDTRTEAQMRAMQNRLRDPREPVDPQAAEDRRAKLRTHARDLDTIECTLGYFLRMGDDHAVRAASALWLGQKLEMIRGDIQDLATDVELLRSRIGEMT